MYGDTIASLLLSDQLTALAVHPLSQFTWCFHHGLLHAFAASVVAFTPHGLLIVFYYVFVVTLRIFVLGSSQCIFGALVTAALSPWSQARFGLGCARHLRPPGAWLELLWIITSSGYGGVIFVVVLTALLILSWSCFTSMSPLPWPCSALPC